ncbi:hypothetical protein MBCUR_15460 [Methanobrevibacter curvatus]|uniref:Uncharacterized protein n=1 Tax=Methanobrevibacter curvatus TaxID=49547 RepID=A0A165ZSP0_9EURY|nr:hypothetical protein MBCUR_15460 [Methanobrevibacter curvatus]
MLKYWIRWHGLRFKHRLLGNILEKENLKNYFNLINNDKPINLMSEDILDRKEFSKKLGKLILEYKLSDSLVIGLLGEWVQVSHL